MPKIELHRHLEGSIRPAIAWSLALEQGIDLGFSDYPSFEQAALVTKPIGGLKKVLNAMALTRKTLASAAAIEKVAYEIVQDAKADNIKLFELRFAPSLLAQAVGLDYPEIFAAVAAGAAKASTPGSPIAVGLICSLRRSSPREVNSAIVQAMLRAKTDAKLQVPLVGIDLSDDERGTAPEDYAEFFDPLREAGFGTTVHTGLNTSADYIWQTLNTLKPQRIGHGILASGNAALIEEIRRRGIHLELSVLSNWITETVPSVKDHPLPIFINKNLSLGINSDDPGLFGSDLQKEYALLEQNFGLTQQDFLFINQRSLEASFLPNECRDRVRAEYFGA